MTIPSSRSLIFEVKSTGSELAFIRVQRLGLDNCSPSTDFGRLRTSSEDSGILRESSEMIVSSSKNPSTPRIKISRLHLRKSWQVYPCQYSDMVHLFVKPVPVLSMITNQVLDYIYQAHSHRILQWNHQQLSQANLERFAKVVHRKGAPLNNCFAFFDGTVRLICRPGTVNQRLLYKGHKSVHGIKFQSVVTSDGMIANMYSPVGKLSFL